MNYEEKIKKLEALIEESEARIEELEAKVDAEEDVLLALEREKEVVRLVKAKQEAEEEALPIWKPDDGEEYYIPDDDDVIVSFPWRDDRTDNYLLKRGTVFKSEEEAGNYDRAQKLIETIRRERFKAQGNWYPNELTAYTICWNRLRNRVDIDDISWSFSSGVFGFWWHLDVLQGVIQKYKSQLKWYFTEYLPSIN